MQKSENRQIEIQGIYQCFGQKKVLNNIHLNIAGGEIFGLLGPTGAGKTTLLKILTSQLDTAGLYERLSCYDNLLLFTQIYGISKENIEEVLKKVGLLEAKKRPVLKLSKGMKQRLVLARAIMNEPKVLFLDEPTSGLDPASTREIHKLILELKEQGTTVFLTTHNMEEAEKLCDNIALLHDGNIVEYGNPKEICRRYNHRNKIEILRKDGKWLSLENNEKNAKEIYDYLQKGLVETIHSTEPNLENVFVELTGRGFE